MVKTCIYNMSIHNVCIRNFLQYCKAFRFGKPHPFGKKLVKTWVIWQKVKTWLFLKDLVETGRFSRGKTFKKKRFCLAPPPSLSPWRFQESPLRRPKARSEKRSKAAGARDRWDRVPTLVELGFGLISQLEARRCPYLFCKRWSLK